jgi:triacylglycerol lipase
MSGDNGSMPQPVVAEGPGAELGVFWPSLPNMVREGASVLRMATMPLQRRLRKPTMPSYRVPVLLIPGFMAGDWTMARLAHLLEQRGHPTARARIGNNIGCTTDLVRRLEERLDEFSEQQHQRVAIVGWSRGGTLGKLLTLRRPGLVAGLITLASPNVNPLAVSRMVNAQINVLVRLHAAGARRFLSADCISGQCADDVRQMLLTEFPTGLPYVSFYSRTDAVVDWRACRDPDASELVEVRATHLQMGANPKVLAMVAERLAAVARGPIGAIEASTA